MQSIQALRERRTALAKTIHDLLEQNPGEKWNADLQAKYDEGIGQINDIEAEMSRINTYMEKIADEGDVSHLAQHAEKRGRDEKKPELAMFSKWLRGGDNALSAEDWVTVRNTMSTTTGSEGGYAVPSLISSQLYDAMKAYGAMRAVAEIIPTSDGKPLSFPTSDGTSETGEWIAQNTTATAADPTFGTASLNVFKASSKIVAVPYELLQDSVIDVESFVRNRLAQRLGRLGNTAFTVGTGTTQPDGVVPKASSGKVGTTGQTLTIIYDDMVDLVHAVDPAYRGRNCSFMTNDSLLKVMRKIKDTAGRPIWTPSYDGGINIGINRNGAGGYSDQNTAIMFDTLLGYPVYVNNDIAAPAANAKTLLFGDFSYYKIRDAMQVEMFRFTDSAYTKLGQVGFLAWCRMGGNLIDTNAVKYYQHSAT